MLQKYNVGQKVLFANYEGTVRNAKVRDGKFKYYVEWGSAALPMWLDESQLSVGSPGAPPRFFHQRHPHLLVVDDFYPRPGDIRAWRSSRNTRPTRSFTRESGRRSGSYGPPFGKSSCAC